MGDNTGIEWTDATWNPTTGCDQVSPGCDHCYAMTLAPRLKAMGSAHYQTDGDPLTSGPGFGIAMHPDALDKPLRWQRPRRIFVNSMSDLFHDGVSDEFIARVFAVMAMASQHTFQVLSKRHGRMRSLLRNEDFEAAVDAHARELGFEGYFGLPLPNVWLGVSVEDQKRADLRIPALLSTPAAVRFLSCEPLLGDVDLRKAGALASEPVAGHCIDADLQPWHDSCAACGTIDWVIVGGESGPGARPMHPDWARKLRDQCYFAGVPFHFKQWGEFIATKTWPWVNYAEYERVGKKAAGRELDGRTWDQFPEPVTA